MKTAYSEILARTLMERFPDPDRYPYQSWCYSQGFMLWGFIRLFETCGRPEYRDYVLRYCDEHVNREGDILGFTGVSLDDMMAGSVLVWAWKTTHEERYLKACRHIRESFFDYPRNADGGFWHSRLLPGEMWVDGLFMGLMFLANYGAEIGDADACFKEAADQLRIAFACCEKDGSGLLYHAYSANTSVRWANPVTGKSPEVWSEGLGWYAMALVETLERIPEGFPGREDLVIQLRKLAHGLEITQDCAQHLWYQVVDKPRGKRNWLDTSGSAMFLYSLHKAMRLGFINNTYAGFCEDAFAGLKTKLAFDRAGRMDVCDACDGLCVQEDYDAYVDYPRRVNCKEAVAAVLWACAEMEYFAD